MAEINTISLIDDANLVAYWRFEGNSSATVGSITGSDTNMTYGAYYGKYGQGSVYGGTSRIDLTDSGDALNLGSAISIVFWVKNYPGGIVLCNEYYTQGSNGTGWYVSPASFLNWGLNSGTGDSISSNGTSWNDGNWHHCAYTFEDTGNQAYAYVDGVQTNSSTDITEDLEYKAGMKRIIGARYNFNGPVYQNYLESGTDLDDLAVFSDVLTPKEIRDIYDAGPGGAPFISL